MLQIFKYFFGIIGILILVYVLIVVLRTVLTSGFTNSAEILKDPTVQANVASATKDAVQAVGEFSLANFLRNFRPFAYAPIEVSTDVTDRATPRYYNDDFSKYNSNAWRENLNWQDMRNAPDSHPTDFVPIGSGYYQDLTGSESGTEDTVPSSEYIKPSTKTREIIYDNDVLTGRAYYKVFTLGKFPIYVLDFDGNTVGLVTAYANSGLAKDETAAFRAVIDLDAIPVARGYLMYKNENFDISGIKAVTVVPVLFAK